MLIRFSHDTERPQRICLRLESNPAVEGFVLVRRGSLSATPAPFLRTGEVARHTGLPAKAIRCFCDQGCSFPELAPLLGRWQECGGAKLQDCTRNQCRGSTTKDQQTQEDRVASVQALL